jgi:hypothetical protein
VCVKHKEDVYFIEIWARDSSRRGASIDISNGSNERGFQALLPKKEGDAEHEPLIRFVRTGKGWECSESDENARLGTGNAARFHPGMQHVWCVAWHVAGPSRGAEVRKRFLDVTTGQTALRLARALSPGRRLT